MSSIVLAVPSTFAQIIELEQRIEWERVIMKGANTDEQRRQARGRIKGAKHEILILMIAFTDNDRAALAHYRAAHA